MTTTWTTNKKVRNWHKFFVSSGLGGAVLGVSFLLNNSYLRWGGGIMLAIAGWFAIMSVFELLEKISNK